MSETAAQVQSLTTGQDTRQSRRRMLVGKATSPNKKREGGHLWSNVIVLGLCIAGLVLTLKEQARGEQYMFMVAFSVCIGVSGAETLLNIVLMIASGRCSKNGEENTGCCKKCGTCCVAVMINLIYLVGCCVSFGLLVAALIMNKDADLSEACGCVNGFGCANILAIVAAIIYGIRVLLIVACLPCIICAGCCSCSLCCADAAGMERTLDGGESGQAAQAEQPPEQQNSSI